MPRLPQAVTLDPFGKDPHPRSIFAQTRSIFTTPAVYLHNTNACPPLGFFGAVVGGVISIEPYPYVWQMCFMVLGRALRTAAQR